MMVRPNPLTFKYIDEGSKYPKLPRIQFRTNGELQGQTISGAAGSLFNSRLNIPNGMMIADFVSDFNNLLRLRVQDDFQRRWMPNNQDTPLPSISLYPGSGISQEPRINYWMIDPRPDYGVKPGQGGMADQRKRDTQLLLDFTKTVALDQDIWFGAMCTADWKSTVQYTDFYERLNTEKFWEWFWKYGQSWHTSVDTNVLADPAQTSQSFRLRVDGDFVLEGISWTGGANVTINIFASDVPNGLGLTTQPLRIDLVGTIGGSPPGFRWPGVYYLQNGIDLQIDLEKLSPGVAVDETLTLHGHSIWK